MNAESTLAIAINNFNTLLATTKIGIFFIGFAVFLFLILLFFVFFYFGKKTGILETQKLQEKLIEEARIDAIKRSRSVLNGQLIEQIARLFPDFPCNIADCRLSANQ